MSCMSQNFRLFHVSNLSVRNFRIFLLMYTGSPSQRLRTKTCKTETLSEPWRLSRRRRTTWPDASVGVFFIPVDRKESRCNSSVPLRFRSSPPAGGYLPISPRLLSDFPLQLSSLSTSDFSHLRSNLLLVRSRYITVPPNQCSPPSTAILGPGVTAPDFRQSRRVYPSQWLSLSEAIVAPVVVPPDVLCRHLIPSTVSAAPSPGAFPEPSPGAFSAPGRAVPRPRHRRSAAVPASFRRRRAPCRAVPSQKESCERRAEPKRDPVGWQGALMEARPAIHEPT